MSASNWAVCPKCRVRVHKKKVEYGRVSEDEYKEFLDNQEGPEPESLREDYEIWVDADGYFFVSYKCWCEVCGFKYDFSYEKQLIVNSSAGKDV